MEAAKRPGTEANGPISQDDVSKLLTNNTPETKIKVLNKITALYTEEDTKVPLRSTELELMEDIFRALVKMAETEVRVAFSNSIKNSPKLPKDIALALAQDIEEVAIPMLNTSKVFSNEDLLKLISGAKGTNQLLAIASREHVAKEVSDALIEKGEEVTETLLKNFGADISEATYNKILARSGGSEVVIKAMVEKGTMPVTIMEKLLKHVDGEMRKELDQKYQVVFESVDIKKEMEKNLQQATMRMMGWRSDDAAKKKLLKELSDSGSLPPFIALTSGDYTMFEITLSRLARVPIGNARILLNDQGALGFKAIYDKAGLPSHLFEATSVVFQVIQMLDAEQPNINGVKGRKLKAEDIINRMKIVVGSRRINNLNFLTEMMENNIKWDKA